MDKTSAAANDAAAAANTDSHSHARASSDTDTDTHVVGFEGARDQVIVVARKMDLQRWLFGDEVLAVTGASCVRAWMVVGAASVGRLYASLLTQ